MQRFVVENDRKREIAERLSFAKDSQAFTEIFDVGLFGFIDQHIPRIGLRCIVSKLRDEASLRNIEVAAAFHHFFPCLFLGHRNPFCAHRETSRYLEQGIEHQRPSLDDRLFHCQNTHEVAPDAEVVSFRFDVRINDLIVEKLSALRASLDPDGLKVEETAEEG